MINKKNTLLWTFYFLLTFSLSASSRYIKVTNTYKVEALGSIKKLELSIPIPQDYEGRQKVHHIRYSKPLKSTFHDSGTAYAKFVFKNVRRDLFIEVDIFIEIFDYDYTYAFNHTEPVDPLKKRSHKRFTKNKGIYKLGKDFKLPEGIVKCNTTLTKVVRTHKLVESHLDYQTFFGKDLGANKAWELKKGDCSEYAALMAGICRKQGIPARQVSGFTLSKSKSALGLIFKSSNHAWLEVYLEEAGGWVPFDPTHSDSSKSTTFFQLQNKYIYVNTDNLKGYVKWRWWGEGVHIKVPTERTWQEFSSLEEMMASRSK